MSFTYEYAFVRNSAQLIMGHVEQVKLMYFIWLSYVEMRIINLLDS